MTKPRSAREEQWLKDCHTHNKWEAFLLDQGINGGISGTPYVKFVPKADGEEFPRIQVVDPATMRIESDERDISHITGYIWQDSVPDPAGKPGEYMSVRQVAREDGGRLSWTITDQEKRNGSDRWETVDTTEWPHAWAPFHHCKNLPAPNEMYGEPDISFTVIEQNKALNFSYSNWNRINKHHAHPKVYLIGNQGLPAVLVKMGPNAIWDIPHEGAQVGQLAPAHDGTPIMQFIDHVTDEMLEETMTPSVSIGRQTMGERGNPTGVALRVRMWPMLMKTEVKRLSYGAWIIEIDRRLFELGGFGPDCRIEITWPEMLPIDPLAERQVAQIDQALGASETTLLTNIGFNYQTELENKADEQARQDERQGKLQDQAMKRRASVALGNTTQVGAGASAGDGGGSSAMETVGVEK